jgi:hypothetical protein
MVVSVQPAVVAAELKLVVAEVAEVVVVLAHAAVARLLGVAEEQKMGVDYNMCKILMPLLLVLHNKHEYPKMFLLVRKLIYLS